MSTVEKIASGIIGLGLVTTLILPKRQTVGVLSASGTFVQKVLGTAMGTARPV